MKCETEMKGSRIVSFLFPSMVRKIGNEAICLIVDVLFYLLDQINGLTPIHVFSVYLMKLDERIIKAQVTRKRVHTTLLIQHPRLHRMKM